jgi:hypothetical protein
MKRHARLEAAITFAAGIRRLCPGRAGRDFEQLFDGRVFLTKHLLIDFPELHQHRLFFRLR